MLIHHELINGIFEYEFNHTYSNNDERNGEKKWRKEIPESSCHYYQVMELQSLKTTLIVQ